MIEYNFISMEEAKKLYNSNKFPLKLHENDAPWDNAPKELYSCVAYENPSETTSKERKIVGLCMGTVYKPNTTRRTSQWRFGVNRFRELYIDYIHTEIESNCKGSELLQKVEEKLRLHMNEVQRKNIYTVSLFDAVSFYEKNGYVEINTPEDEEDEDYPSAFVDGVGIGTWMCKSLLSINELDGETKQNFFQEYMLADASNRNSVTLIKDYLNFPVDVEIFLKERKEDDLYKQFQSKCGRKYRKYTKEEIMENFYPKYSGFLEAFKVCFDSFTFSESILPYFKGLTPTQIKKIVMHYCEVSC